MESLSRSPESVVSGGGVAMPEIVSLDAIGGTACSFDGLGGAVTAAGFLSQAVMDVCMPASREVEYFTCYPRAR